jgi:hypothetical protein
MVIDMFVLLIAVKYLVLLVCFLLLIIHVSILLIMVVFQRNDEQPFESAFQ